MSTSKQGAIKLLFAAAALTIAYAVDTLDRRVVELQSRVTLLEDNINKGE